MVAGGEGADRGGKLQCRRDRERGGPAICIVPAAAVRQSAEPHLPAQVYSQVQTQTILHADRQIASFHHPGEGVSGTALTLRPWAPLPCESVRDKES